MSVSFDASNTENLRAGSSTDWDFGTATDFSVSFWIKRAATGAAHGLFSRSAGGTGWVLQLSATNKLQLQIAGVGFQTASNWINDTNWHHVAVVVDRSTDVNMYLDGVATNIASVPNQDATPGSSTPMSVGVATAYMNGYLEDVAIYSGLLSGADVAAMHSGSLRNDHAGSATLVTHWPLHFPQVGAVADGDVGLGDYTANGNNLTILTAPDWSSESQGLFWNSWKKDDTPVLYDSMGGRAPRAIRRRVRRARGAVVGPTIEVLSSAGFSAIEDLSAPRRRRRSRSPAVLFDATPKYVRHYQTARGAYRVFNAAEYRFYRSNTAPPLESDTPFATNATLPHTPADTYADGTWWLSCSYFNGVLNSGFLPIGANGETYLRLDVTAGVVVTGPPSAPTAWKLIQEAGGVVRVLGWYHEPAGVVRATEWALWFTNDGSTPPTTVSIPDATGPISAGGMAVIEYRLPAQANGVTVKVRLATRRLSPTTYSAANVVETLVVDRTGPTGALGPVVLFSGP